MTWAPNGGRMSPSLDRNGQAYRAGIRRGDIITKIGDKQLDEKTSYYNALFSYLPGQSVSIEVVRGKTTLTVEVTLVEANSGG